MKSFKSYISESRIASHDELVKVIDAYKKAGEILNPQYNDLVSQAKRLMNGGKWSGKPDSILDAVRDHRDDADLSDLYYTSFDGFNSHNKIEKLVAKLEKKNQPAYKTLIADTKNYLKLWKPVGDDLKTLKSKVVKVSQKRAEAKAVADTSMKKKFADSSSLIKIFEAHLKEYIERARQESKKFVDSKLEILKKNDWNLDKVAPRPNSNTMGRDEYMMAKNRRDTFSSFTKPKANRKPGEPTIVEPNQMMIDRYIKMNEKGAEDAYRNFMAKMIQKIGKPVIDAKMTGNIWTNATLHVTTDDGEEQVWDTKMILNFSKYQKMFNQFPSRRKK